jgi:type IV pilus assembly protein PilA
MLNKVKNRKQEGFTIIEVLIVLAIAGLIMLVVFLAVPALQRNARNTQAKSEAASILGATTEFMSNNNGKLPVAADNTAILNNAKLQNVTALTVEANAGTTAPTSSTAVLRTGTKCALPSSTTLASVVAKGSARQIALLFLTEDKAGDLFACQDS